jgi:hypothetical protein
MKQILDSIVSPQSNVRVEVIPRNGFKAPVSASVSFSPGMHEIQALQAAQSSYLAEHPDALVSPFDIDIAVKEVGKRRRCYVLAAVGGVRSDRSGHWSINVSDGSKKVSLIVPHGFLRRYAS